MENDSMSRVMFIETTPAKIYNPNRNASFNPALLSVYVLALLLCLSGNSLVCFTIFRNQKMRTPYYYLIVNLAVADAGVAFISVFVVLQYCQVELGVYWFSYVAMITDWNCWKIKNVIHFVSVEQLSVKQHKTLCPVGIPDNQPIIEPRDAGCKLVSFAGDVFFGNGFLSLAYISLERYYGICHFEYARSTKIKYIIPMIWFAAGVLYIPDLVACKASSPLSKMTCDCFASYPRNALDVSLSLIAIQFLFSCLVMMFCYFRICQTVWGKKEEKKLLKKGKSNSKISVIKMLLAATVCFIGSWMPYFVLTFMITLHTIPIQQVEKLWLAFKLVGFSNCAWNPFVYCIFGTNFRKAVKETLLGCCRKRKLTGQQRQDTRRLLNKDFSLEYGSL